MSEAELDLLCLVLNRHYMYFHRCFSEAHCQGKEHKGTSFRKTAGIQILCYLQGVLATDGWSTHHRRSATSPDVLLPSRNCCRTTPTVKQGRKPPPLLRQQDFSDTQLRGSLASPSHPHATHSTSS
eukprot:7613619-Pyramimonas_sp.AAC.1